MMRSVLNVLFLFSLWSTIFARPFLSSVPLVRREYNVDDPTLPPAIKQVCAGGVNATTVMDTVPFGSSGTRLTTGSCTPPEPKEASDDSVSISERDLDARQDCKGAANDCGPRFGSSFAGQGVSKCGAPCRSACYLGSGGPNPNDCQHIINDLYSNSTQLFTLDQDNYVLFWWGTCGIGFQNQIAPSPLGCSRKIIYDYTDIGAIAQYLAWNCQATQGARGGKCTGTSGVYVSNIPDYYVQVYRNGG